MIAPGRAGMCVRPPAVLTVTGKPVVCADPPEAPADAADPGGLAAELAQAAQAMASAAAAASVAGS
jgi:hypothetical protein